MDAPQKQLVSISSQKLKEWATHETDRRDGKTQTTLANSLGVTQSAVSDWCKGIKDFLRMDTIKAIAKYRNESTQEVINFLRAEPVYQATTAKVKEISANYATRSEVQDLVATLTSQGQILGDILVTVRLQGDEIKQLKRYIKKQSTLDNDASKSLRY
jgi:predicted transcriptional regulator